MLFKKRKNVEHDVELNIFDTSAPTEKKLTPDSKVDGSIVIVPDERTEDTAIPASDIVIPDETPNASPSLPNTELVISAEAEEKRSAVPLSEIVIAAEEPALPKIKAELSLEEEEKVNSPDVSRPETLTEAEVVTETETETESEAEAEDKKEDLPEIKEDDSYKSLSDFERSIKEFSLKDVGEVKPAKKAPLDIFRVFTLILCAAVFTVSIWTVVRNVSDKIRGEKIYGEILDSVADGFAMGDGSYEGGYVSLLTKDPQIAMTPTMDDIIKNGIEEIKTPSAHDAELAKMRASLESLRNINEDIYGWIQIPGTNINYPVAQSGDNVYYLDHAYNKDNLVNGSIFADYRCKPLVTDNYNTVLYGHNITSGSMFHDVEEFFKKDVFKNTSIYLYTFDGIFVFKAFSIHEAAFDSGFVDTYFPDGESFVKFAEGLRDDSEVKNSTEFSEDDRIITLSTCTNGLHTKRYALHAVLVETITE